MAAPTQVERCFPFTLLQFACRLCGSHFAIIYLQYRDAARHLFSFAHNTMSEQLTNESRLLGMAT